MLSSIHSLLDLSSTFQKLQLDKRTNDKEPHLVSRALTLLALLKLCKDEISRSGDDTVRLNYQVGRTI